MPAPLADEVARMLARFPPRGPISELGIARAREEHRQAAARRAPGPEMTQVSDHLVGASLPVRVYRPAAAVPAVIVYLHGGGWVIGGIEQADGHVRRLAAATGCTLVSVGYRLAPEHPFPAPLDDALAAWHWVLENLPPPGSGNVPFGIAGDSAGGNIATAAAIALRDDGREGPAFQILNYPVLSARMNTLSYRQQVDGPLLRADDMRWFWSHYAPDPTTRSNPLAAPLEAVHLDGLPPTLIINAQCDPLRDEGASYAARLYAAKVEVEHHCYAGMIHGFCNMADMLAAGRAALDRIAAFVARQTAARHHPFMR